MFTASADVSHFNKQIQPECALKIRAPHLVHWGLPIAEAFAFMATGFLTYFLTAEAGQQRPNLEQLLIWASTSI